MFRLSGKISDRIRAGRLPRSVQIVDKLDRIDPPPRLRVIRAARGRSLGQGAHRRRNGGAS